MKLLFLLVVWPFFKSSLVCFCLCCRLCCSQLLCLLSYSNNGRSHIAFTHVCGLMWLDCGGCGSGCIWHPTCISNCSFDFFGVLPCLVRLTSLSFIWLALTMVLFIYLFRWLPIRSYLCSGYSFWGSETLEQQLCSLISAGHFLMRNPHGTISTPHCLYTFVSVLSLRLSCISIQPIGAHYITSLWPLRHWSYPLNRGVSQLQSDTVCSRLSQRC